MDTSSDYDMTAYIIIKTKNIADKAIAYVFNSAYCKPIEIGQSFQEDIKKLLKL